MEQGTGDLWVVVLAGGEGRRLAATAVARYGYPRPKQYCDFGDGPLLCQTIQRALRLVPEDRVVVVTSRGHRADADECLARYPAVRRVEQPFGRDTTPGILLPLSRVLAEDPDARVVVLPSDHAVADVDGFVGRVRDAARSLVHHPEDLLLLGAESLWAEDGYGWIVPMIPAGGRWPAVAAFHEKPTPAQARELVDQGALVNTFVMVGAGRTFVDLCRLHVPAWPQALLGADDAGVEHAYATLPPSNFSFDVLVPARTRLRVVPLPEVGWSDIGTPDRLDRALGHPRPAAAGAHAAL